MSQAKILLVEDNPITRKLVRFALSKRGYEVFEAEDGGSALAIFAKIRPSLALVDLALADMDGFALAGKLRELPGGTQVPLIAFSGFLSKVQEAQVSAAGFDDLITKPVEPSRLLMIIQSHLPEDERVAAFGHGRRLVVADDDPVQCKLASIHLERCGFEVVRASDGQEALELAKANPPHAIVADVMMPRVDGFGLCQRIRSDPQLADRPIVLMTNSYIEHGDRELAREYGADDLVLRTPKLGEVIDALRRAIEAPTAAAGTEVSHELEQQRLLRVNRQLDRQVALNAGLTQRCASLSAELAVLSAISEAASADRSLDAALDTALAGCFDAGGISKGVLFLRDVSGRLTSRAFGPDCEGAGEFFGEVALLEEWIASGTIAKLVAGENARHDRILEGCRSSAAVILPLVQRGLPLGALFLASASQDVLHEERLVFLQGVAHQIGLAVALAQSFESQRRSEREARGRAALLRAIFDSIADGVIVVDASGKIVDWNQTAEKELRLAPHEGPPETWPERAGIYRPDQDVAIDWSALPIAAALRGEIVDASDIVLRPPRESEERYVRITARPLRTEGSVGGAVAVFRDATQERLAQTQLMLTDRMASVGLLAAGVAHEINNPLAALVVNIDLAAEALGKVGQEGLEDVREELVDARTAVDRVLGIVRDLKLFSRTEDDEPAAVDAESVMESTLRIAHNEMKHRARVVCDYQSVPPVRATESRLGQVFLNLVVNAAQAIPVGRADQNEIRVSIRPAEQGVLIEVSDTGEGIPPEVQSRIFTPFFTTKVRGIGTGLGLSISQRIVTGFGGEISVRSGLGRGTTIRVVLPAAAGPNTERRTARAVLGGPPPRGRILVVDDEPAMRKALQRMLRLDHEVDAVEGGHAALERIVGGERYDVVFCDLMMPSMTGMEFYAALGNVAPEVCSRVVFLTGGVFSDDERELVKSTGVELVEKPFELERVRKLVAARVASFS